MARAALLALSLSLLAAAALAQQPSTGFLAQLPAGGAAAGGAANATAGPRVCNGSTGPNVIVESVTPVPAPGQTAKIELRNIGGQPADVTGWRLSAGGGNASGGGGNDTLQIASEARCKPNGTIAAGQALVFKPQSDANPCGFAFALGPSGTVKLSDASGQDRSVMSWSDAAQGTQIHVPLSGSTALRVPGSSNVIDVLKSLGTYQTLLLALQSTGLDKQLTAASDPNYTGPQLPQQSFTLDLPWWFAGAQGAAAAPPPPPPTAPTTPPPVGIPAAGPFTVFAPTDQAFDNLLTTLGGAQGKLPLDALLKQPTLKDILLYHIAPGLYTSTYLRNNTPIYTAKGVEVVPIADGCQTEGKLELHDSCVDKPTGDNFTCAEQKAFGKCSFPFMTSPLAANWQGGFCQRTCERCDCSPGSGVPCSVVQAVDIDASNGVIHGISRVLFPPPLFSKEQAIRDAVAYNESLARNQSLGIAPPPGMSGLNEMPGAVPGAVPGAGLPAATPNASLPAATPAANATPPAAAASGPPAEAASPTPASPSAPNAAASPAPGARRLRWV